MAYYTQDMALLPTTITRVQQNHHRVKADFKAAECELLSDYYAANRDVNARTEAAQRLRALYTANVGHMTGLVRPEAYSRWHKWAIWTLILFKGVIGGLGAGTNAWGWSALVGFLLAVDAFLVFYLLPKIRMEQRWFWIIVSAVLNAGTAVCQQQTVAATSRPHAWMDGPRIALTGYIIGPCIVTHVICLEIAKRYLTTALPIGLAIEAEIEQVLGPAREVPMVIPDEAHDDDDDDDDDDDGDLANPANSILNA